MKKRKINVLRCAVLAVVLLMFSSGIVAAPDVLIDLRLYKGAREKENPSPTVVTSYYLKPISSAGKILDVDLSGEQTELKKIFNLEGLKLMTQAKWAWKKGLVKKQFELVVLNGREFLVQLTLLEKKDYFKLEVLEKGREKDKESLTTELIIPQGKTSVFGFEDSAGKPYFLSCQRHPDKEGASGEPIKISSLKRPKLLKKVNPVYPKDALRARVSGQVRAEVVTDIYGKVADITEITGHPLLIDSTLTALRQWVYAPFILKGTPKIVRFTVIVSYSLNEEAREGKVKTEQPKDLPGLEEKPKLLKKVTPKYPKEALKVKLSGEVRLKVVTDIYGKVEKVEKVSGHPLLTPAAVNAVKQWLYEPYLLDGKPAPVKFKVTVKFRLDKKKEEAKQK